MLPVQVVRLRQLTTRRIKILSLAEQALLLTGEDPRPARLCLVLLISHSARTVRRRSHSVTTHPTNGSTAQVGPEQDEDTSEGVPPSHYCETPPSEHRHLNNTPSYNSGTKTRTTTPLVNPNPETAEPVYELETDYIDFGTLVPEGEPSRRTAIHLRFPDDGSSTKTFTVGRDEQCEIKLEDEDIGG